MLHNEYLVEKICVDTAEKEPAKVSRKWGVQSGSFRGHGDCLSAVLENMSVSAQQSGDAYR